MSRKRILIVDDEDDIREVAQVSERTRLAQLGAEGILNKPFDLLKLAGEVASTLRWT